MKTIKSILIQNISNSIATAAILTVPFCYFSPAVNASPIVSASLNYEIPPQQTIRDINGVYGAPGRELRIASLTGILDAGQGSAQYDDAAGTLNLIIPLNVSYTLVDANSQEFVGANSFHLLWEETAFTVDGGLSFVGSGSSSDESGNGVGDPLIFGPGTGDTEAWVIEIFSTTVINAAVSGYEFSGSTDGTPEMIFNVTPEFGGGTITANAFGEVVIPTPDVTSTLTLLLGSVFAIVAMKAKKLD
jgi:hypothetical protein